MITERYRFVRHEKGFLLLNGRTPLGYLEAGSIQTPSGAEYAVSEGADGEVVMQAADGRRVAGYMASPSPVVRDAAAGTEWQLKPNWLQEFTGAEEFGLEDLFAVEYTLEDTQGTVPNRVVLFLAFLIKCVPDD